MRKKIFKILGISIAVLILVLIIINLFIIPLGAKALIIKALEDELGRKVEIKKLSYMPLANLSLGGITLYKDLSTAQPVVTIEKLKLKLLLLPYLFKRKVNFGIDIANLSAQDAKMSGSVRTNLVPDKSSSLGHVGTIKFVDFLLDVNFLPAPIEKIKGLVKINRDDIEIKDVSFNLNGNKLISEGNLILKDDYVKIDRFDMKFLNSSLNIIGDVTSLRNPFLNIYGESRINIADLEKILAQKGTKIELDGIFDTALFFKGQLNKPKESELGIKAQSPEVRVMGITATEVDLDLRMLNGVLTTPKLRAFTYDGILTGFVNAEPFSRNTPFATELLLKNMDLATWAREANFNKKISGKLSSNFVLKGQGGNLDALKGNGWISIDDGYLWGIGVLGGMANILSMPKLGSVVFKKARGNFTIKNRIFTIEDFTCKSEVAELSLAGDIGFDESVDLLVTTNLTSNLIEDSSDAAKIANILIQQAGNFFGRVRITGTLKNPQYKVGASSGKPGSGGGSKVVEKIFKEELGDLLKDLLE